MIRQNLWLVVGLGLVGGLLFLWWQDHQRTGQTFTSGATPIVYPQAANATSADPTQLQLQGLSMQLGNLFQQANVQIFDQLRTQRDGTNLPVTSSPAGGTVPH